MVLFETGVEIIGDAYIKEVAGAFDRLSNRASTTCLTPTCRTGRADTALSNRALCIVSDFSRICNSGRKDKERVNARDTTKLCAYGI